MRLPTVILTLCLAVGGTNAIAQSSLDNVVEDTFFSQNPATKAAILAAMNDDIVERVDKITGETYYLRREVHPFTQEVIYHMVVFDANQGAFIVPNVNLAQTQDPVKEKEDWKNNPQSNVKQDSCRLRTPQQEAAPRPRRSSTIKIAEEF